MNPAEVLTALLDPSNRDNLVAAFVARAKAAKFDAEREYWTACADAIKGAVRDIAEGRMNEWRTRCDGAWALDRRRVEAAWNKSPDGRAELVRGITDPHGTWYDWRSKCDRRGDFWSRVPCGSQATLGEFCGPCARIASDARALVQSYRDDLRASEAPPPVPRTSRPPRYA